MSLKVSQMNFRKLKEFMERVETNTQPNPLDYPDIPERE